jgi:hypothetical protein
MKIELLLIIGLFKGQYTFSQEAPRTHVADVAGACPQPGVPAPKPVFRDPVYDGAADPDVL